jgi:altronate hydrolase
MEIRKVETSVTVPLDECAIIVHQADNVAVLRKTVADGTTLVFGVGVIRVGAAIDAGHRVALRGIPAGELVRQYGQPIGTSLGIAAGDPVTRSNMSDDVPVVRSLPEDLNTPPPAYLPPHEVATFMGFRRGDGRVGTRNFVLIVPTSMCASHEALQVATVAEFTEYSRERFPNVDGVVAIPHNKGCGCPDGSNIDILLRVLSNYADHPNVGGVVLMELGCEKTNLSVVEKYLERCQRTLAKPFVRIGVQDAGGTQAAIARGLSAVREMLPAVNATSRERVPVSELVLGVKCGASDAFSGISANPSLGRAADELVRSRGTVLITEVPEFCGAEHVLAQRAKDADTGRAVYRLVDWYKAYAHRFGAGVSENPSPGNVKAGLLNITIKSLGAITKAGTTRIEGVVEYGAPPATPGLHLMQGPGYDQESVPGLVAGGATVVVFTTGLGSTMGNAIVPVIKLTSNTRVFERMPGDMDLSAGGVLDGTESVDDVGTRLVAHIRSVASGEILAKAEQVKHREFQVWSEQAVSL